jgi:RNA polymerase sigma factor (sigma-70 family)
MWRWRADCISDPGWWRANIIAFESRLTVFCILSRSHDHSLDESHTSWTPSERDEPMNDTESSWSTGEIDDLIADSRWLHGLARRLVADSGVAEDLVQEAYVIALENRARVRGRLAQFAAGVIRKLALGTRRSEARRAKREVAVGRSRDPGDDDVASSVARVEQQRKLAEHLLAVRDPYRRVLLLRFVEGLSQREIARRLEIPEATVNSQITRGLALLREALDREVNGDRSQWVLALTPLSLPASTSFSVLATGAMFMGKTKPSTMLASVLAASFLGACLLFVPRDDSKGESVLPNSGDPSVAVVSPQPIVIEPNTVVGEPSVLREVVEELGKDSKSRFTVRVVRESDRTPLGGVAVHAAVPGSSAPTNADLFESLMIRAGFRSSFRELLERRDSTVASVPTDEKGYARFELSGNATVMAEQDGLHGFAMIPPDTSEIDLTLAPIEFIHVDVRDDRGSPVADVPVALCQYSPPSAGESTRHNLHCAFRTDSQGNVELPIRPFVSLDGRAELMVRLAIPVATPVERRVRQTSDSVTLAVPDTIVLVARVHSASDRGAVVPDGTLVLIGPADSEDQIGVPFVGAWVKDGVATVRRVQARRWRIVSCRA